MKSLWEGEKKRALLAGIFLLALSFVLFILPEWITLNRAIPTLSARFQQATGRTLSIDRLRLSFLSGPELHLYGVTVGALGSSAEFAKAREIRIGFELLPLLWRQITIKEARLIEPSIALIRDQKGGWSIEDLFPKKGGAPGWRVRIQSGPFLIERGAFSLTDHAIPDRPVFWTAEGIDAAIARPGLNGRVALRIESPAIRRGDLPEKPAGLKIEGTVEGEGALFGFKQETAHLTLSLASFDSAFLAPYLSDPAFPFFVKATRLTIDAKSANLLPITRLLRAPELRLEGESTEVAVLFSRGLSPIRIERAEWRYDRREGRFTWHNTRLNDSNLPKTTGRLHSPFSNPQLDVETAGRIGLADLAELLASDRYRNQRLKKWKADGSLDLSLKMKVPLGRLSKTDFNGKLLLSDGSFTPFRAFQPIRKIKASGRVEGNLLVIDSAEGSWGEGQLKGSGRMPNLYKEGLEFDLHATTLDWDTIHLPPSEEPAPSSNAPPGLKETKREAVPEEAAAPSASRAAERGYAVGLIRIDRLKIKNYDFFKCQSALTYQGGALEFRETEAVFEEGQFRANFAQVLFRPDGSYALALTPDLKEVAVAGFLKDFNHTEERPVMSGRALVAGGLNTEGETFQEFKRNLRGKLVVYIENGTIYRFKTLAKIFSLMNLRSLPDLNVKGVPFEALSGTLGIHQGKVTLYDTVLYGRDVRTIANGTIDLGENKLDLLMGVQVFRLLDDILRQIPLLGPILLGQDKMFIASYFDVKGELNDPKVHFKPFKTLKESTLSVLRRAITFPARPEELLG